MSKMGGITSKWAKWEESVVKGQNDWKHNSNIKKHENEVQRA